MTTLMPLVPQGARTQPLKSPPPHRMYSLPQASAAGKTGGLPTAGEVLDPIMAQPSPSAPPPASPA